MKNKLFVFLFVSVFLINFASIGQNTNYPTKKINGIEYYIYTVQASEGLYAISRKFEVSQAVINTANPEIQNGLKAGQEIKIPIQKSIISEPVTSIKTTGVQFIQHKVEPKQTIFAISRMYGVTQDEIKKYNPQIEKGLQIGTVLLIPDKKEPKEVVGNKTVGIKNLTTPISNAVVIPKSVPISILSPSYITHLVEKGETLYSISKKYGVEVAVIVKLNPESGKRIKVGSELKIPRPATFPVAQSILEINKVGDESNALQFAGNKRNIRLAFLLPFMLDNNKHEIAIDRFSEFYAGALLAIQEAKAKGISFEIYTFDTENAEDKTLDVLKNIELKTMDLVIGPAFSNQVPFVANFAKENKINTLIPFSSKIADIDTNPYLFQFNPGSDTELSFVADLLMTNYKNANIVFANIPSISSSDEGNKLTVGLKNILKSKNRKYSEIELNSPDYSDFSVVLKKDFKNLIIFNTDKFAYANPFLSKLTVQSSGLDVVLYEQYSWKAQDVKVPKSVYISPFSVAISPLLPSKFNLKYFQTYGKQPSFNSPRYDLLGYDLCNYFVSLINLYDKELPNKIGTFSYTSGIQSQPIFKRDSKSAGFINQRLYLTEKKNQ